MARRTQSREGNQPARIVRFFEPQAGEIASLICISYDQTRRDP